MKKILLIAIFTILTGFNQAKAQPAQSSLCVQTVTGCIAVNQNFPFPISSNPAPALPTNNFSVNIVTGHSFQTAIVANTFRKSLTVANNNANGDTCWLFIGSSVASLGNSIILPANASYFRNQGTIPSDAIQVTCASNGDSIYVDYQ